MPKYDLAVIGAGWAGYNAAIKAKELGLKVCLIEKDRIGGTCLNYGCIPTKILIQSAKIFLQALKSKTFGVELENPRVNFGQIQQRKDKIISLLAQGMQSRLKGIDFIKTGAQIISPGRIKIESGEIQAKFILIATGSRPVELAGEIIDSDKIISSNEALSLTDLPESLLIVGGGFIGCEFAGLFSALGSQVTIAERMPLLLPGQDSQISRKIEVIFNKKGIKVSCGADISSFNLNNYSHILACLGRAPNISDLGLDSLGLKLENNRIAVDGYLKTSVDNIYAAGDCASKLMLAHYAAYQGALAVENIISDNSHKADNFIVPACVFTEPQISSVGMSEENAADAGIKIKVHKFDFRASAMAHVIDEAEGFIKIISNLETQEVVGACMIGPGACELIAVPTMAISARLNIKQLREMIFAHPTLSESLRETINN
ncbi:MAG: dihydrolipoyl dehydrogenase [Candidatus Omnitrophica bacterium]|nr:dihydrolipoyl dehydrogenase [Candidatus Omnitrophota bacterium]